MKAVPNFPNVTVSFPLARRERNAILRAVGDGDREILDLIHRFRPAEPLVLFIKELYWLAGMLASKAFQESTPSTRSLMKIVDRMDAVIGVECGFRSKPGDDGQLESKKHELLDPGVLLGLQFLAETYPELRPRPTGPVQLIPDFTIPAPAKRAMRSAPRPPA
jgi:hypothetical protein